MSYPVDPSEVHELRSQVEDLQTELEQLATVNAKLVDIARAHRRKRKRAERQAKDYADANARAMRIVEMFYNGPIMQEIARDRGIASEIARADTAYMAGLEERTR